MALSSFVDGVVSRTRYLSLVENAAPLTHSEHRINKYILRHFVSIYFQNIEQVSIGCAVSKSSVGRYLNKLGFSGYNHFKNSIEKGNVDYAYLEKIKKTSNTNDVVNYTHNVVDEYAGYIESLCAQIRGDLTLIDLDRISECILNASTVYVVGASVSGVAATFFSQINSYIRNNIVVLPLDGNELAKRLTNVTNNDLLIAFSYWPHNKLVVNIARYFKSKNAIGIALTNANSNPFSAYCEHVIYLPNKESGIFKSRIKLFLFCEIISTIIFFKSGGRTRIPEIEELTLFFNVFYDEKNRGQS